MTFGEKVRKLRKKKGLTQADLAEKIHVSSRTVQSYESGISYPKSRRTYSDLAEVLGCNADYLRTEGEDTPVSPSDSFIGKAADEYGSRGAKQARELVAEISGLFAGGELDEEDMDEMMKAIQDAYWVSKKMNRKYVPKKSSGKGRDI